ncbi:unnamed protein product [Toxocara canis]|uniref:t-SNARE coiled-coil homology domain-containing protein n=1 Tax=Toxocara canis TaxID=6265 RepID=A0A183V4X2_TOXCA|nr:unnamed protein product [Toxocara canis]
MTSALKLHRLDIHMDELTPNAITAIICFVGFLSNEKVSCFAVIISPCCGFTCVRRHLIAYHYNNMDMPVLRSSGCFCQIKAQGATTLNASFHHQCYLLMTVVEEEFSFCLGFCLFGNEHLNRAVTASITGVDDVARNFKLAVAQMLNEAEMVINSLNEKVDIVGADLTQVKSVLSGIAFLEQTKLYSERIELERYSCRISGIVAIIRNGGVFLFFFLVYMIEYAHFVYSDTCV